MRAIYLLAFVAVVAIFPRAESGMYSHGSRPSYRTEDQDDYYGGAPAKYHKKGQKLAGTMASKNESHPLLGRKFSVSAWGIIAIILGVIIFSTITYYVFMLYPFVCKKDEAYDIIELTEVNSVCNDNVNNVPHLRVYCSSNDISNDISNETRR